MVNVTCAIIKKDNVVLCAQRGPHMKLPYKWEFPGGKIERNETPEECICREIQEELNFEIKITKQLTPVMYDYGELQIMLIPFLALWVSGTLKLNAHIDAKWMSDSKLMNLDWAEADLPILKEYLSL